MDSVVCLSNSIILHATSSITTFIRSEDLFVSLLLISVHFSSSSSVWSQYKLDNKDLFPFAWLFDHFCAVWILLFLIISQVSISSHFSFLHKSVIVLIQLVILSQKFGFTKCLLLNFQTPFPHLKVSISIAMLTRE